MAIRAVLDFSLKRFTVYFAPGFKPAPSLSGQQQNQTVSYFFGSFVPGFVLKSSAKYTRNQTIVKKKMHFVCITGCNYCDKYSEVSIYAVWLLAARTSEVLTDKTGLKKTSEV